MNEEIEQILSKIQEEHDPFEKAKLIKSLKREKQITLRFISSRINLKPSYVSHLLRLLKLPPIIVDGYYSKMVTVSHLFILSRLNNEKDMMSLYEKILSENLTSLQTEEMVREILYGIKSQGDRIEKKEIEDFKMAVDNKDKKIKIIQSRRRGKFILEVDGDLVKTSGELRKIMESLRSLKTAGTGE